MDALLKFARTLEKLSEARAAYQTHRRTDKERERVDALEREAQEHFNAAVLETVRDLLEAAQAEPKETV